MSTHPELQGRIKDHPVVKSEENGKVYVTRDEELEYSYQRLLLIFKCTDDCLTILTKAHIEEMQRFTAIAVDDEVWAESCTRIANEPFKDGVDCSESAYYNMTKYISSALESMTDDQIQNELEMIIKQPMFFEMMRVAMERDFSVEHPYSRYHVAILNFRGPITFNTWETIDGVET